MGQSGGNQPCLRRLMKLPEGVSALPRQTLGHLSNGCWGGGLGFGFAAQAKQIWGLTLIAADARSIFCTKGAIFVSGSYAGL